VYHISVAACTEYFQKIVEENKEPKEIWKLFKDLNPKKQDNFPPSMKFESETCSDYLRKVYILEVGKEKIFINFFLNICI
jgi:hypothetical protein